MSFSIKLRRSGFNFIDKKWGGIYEGGSYIVIGSHKSGRTLLALQFAIAAAEEGEITLFFTNMRPKDLMIQAASLNFDLQKYMDKNLIIVVRVATPEEIYSASVSDDLLVEYLNDIVSVSKQYNPQRIIFDELTPYIGFSNLNVLKKAFLHVLEEIEDRDISSFYVIAEPATKRANEIVDTVVSLVTGVIYLKKEQRKIEKKYYGGTVIITPNVGHTEGQFAEEYRIIPGKGVLVVMDDEIIEPKVEVEPQKKPIYDAPTEEFYSEDLHHNGKSSRYAERNIEAKTAKKPKVVNINAPNVYNFNDFSLIINNQIVLFKSTGEKFNILSFAVSIPMLEKKSLTLDDIKAIIIAATERREKICYIGDLTLVLVPHSTDERIIEIVKVIYENLIEIGLTKDEIKNLIKLFNYEVDENLDKAETILDYLTSPTTTENLYVSIVDFLR